MLPVFGEQRVYPFFGEKVIFRDRAKSQLYGIPYSWVVAIREGQERGEIRTPGQGGGTPPGATSRYDKEVASPSNFAPVHELASNGAGISETQVREDLDGYKNVEKDAFAESNEDIIDAEIVEEDEPVDYETGEIIAQKQQTRRTQKAHPVMSAP